MDRNKCSVCDTGYEWDELTWTCSKTPGYYFCVETDDYGCVECEAGYALN